MNTIKSKTAMKYIRQLITHHDKEAKNPDLMSATRTTMGYTANILRDVRVVLAACIKEGEWLAKQGGK